MISLSLNRGGQVTCTPQSTVGKSEIATLLKSEAAKLDRQLNMSKVLANALSMPDISKVMTNALDKLDISKVAANALDKLDMSKVAANALDKMSMSKAAANALDKLNTPKVKVDASDRRRIASLIASPHAKSPHANEKAGPTVSASSDDVACEISGPDCAPEAASSDDDDGDGDGDPDSDRRKKTRQPNSPPVPNSALIQRKTSQRILRMSKLTCDIGLSRSTIYKLMSEGSFPASIPIGTRAVGWLESDIDVWLDSRINSSKA
ncbi:helix-turn-helix transcriptional regulator [Candidatus Nitrotoga arctica]|uniref:Transcriptional regulator, AlpA family n=1 Tax=Candidatus Nitrotoga arctica TaxID=453162 RepID=A0ABN8AJM4_9PROT|nr:AlpA family transcriptional regulator [Candidatus Nitrotoga arctica]CAG9932044.1 protein of unknown function [Candidatus Nitrotoga arctica]